MTALVRDENDGSLVAGSPVRETFEDQERVAEVHQASERSSIRQSSEDTSRTPCLHEIGSRMPSRLRGEQYIRKSWSSRIKGLLHLEHKLPEGYSFDVRPRPNIPSLDDYQQGYGKVAAIETCDPSLNIYRKFAWLHNRTLLHLQDELSELESELQYLDEYDFTDGDEVRLISRRHDYGHVMQPKESDRRDLINQINAKMKEYDELLLRTQKILGLRRPTERAQRSLFGLIKSTRSLVAQESEWVRYSTDLAALSRGGEHGWFNDKLEDAMNFISRRMTKFFLTTEEQHQQAGKEEIQLTSPDRRDLLLRTVLTFCASLLLLVPVFILVRLQPLRPSEIQRRSNYQFLTILLFTLLFSASCAVLTRARRQEVFQATAAYAAVLVIFLGNTSQVAMATNGLIDQS